MDPQQELFSALLVGLKKEGYEVYDGGLPPEGTPYPFIYLADSQMFDMVNKTAIWGRVAQTIHVWHNNPKQRGSVSELLLGVKQVCRCLKKTENFSWFVVDVNQRIFADTTTKQPLVHGVLAIEFKFS